MKTQFFTINGLKQNPKCLDFHITPVVTLGRSPNDLKNIGFGWNIAIEWGYWAAGILFYKLAP